jgi:guanosine-3',5'-bis(diphosphate) 3'-pyrophosphohydrolase
MHAGQCRGDGTPFIGHPLEVAVLLDEAGAPDHVVAAGALHDLIEKTDVTAAALEVRFGPRVTGLVLAVTDDQRIERYAARKAALRRQVARSGDEALALFAADKLSKLRELGRESAADSGQRSASRELRARRLRHYLRSLALLEERLPGSSLVLKLRRELRRFAGQRQRAATAAGSRA